MTTLGEPAAEAAGSYQVRPVPRRDGDRVLDRALADSGIGRDHACLTSAVKHFKFQQTGERRLHKPRTAPRSWRAGSGWSRNCRPSGPASWSRWARPPARHRPPPRSGFGEHRGKPEPLDVGVWHGVLVATIHPSAVLRAADPDSRERAYAGLVADLTAPVAADPAAA